MSTFQVPIVTFTLEKHPNADSLSLAKIEGTSWICIVKTADFDRDCFGAYIPIDGIAAKDNPYLSFLEGKKVKTIRLRGSISQGVLVPLSKFARADKTYNIGDDVAEELGVKKYVPPVNNSLGVCDQISEPEGFDRYTEIENWKNYPDIIKEGEEVVITEKIHGSNTRLGLISGKFYIGSHRRTLQTEKSYVNKIGATIELKPTAWHKVVERLDLENKVRSIAAQVDSDTVVVYGELYGRGVQDLQYGESDYNFRVFDIKVNGQYLDPMACRVAAKMALLDTVPLLYQGTFNKELLDMRFGKDSISGTHVREGFVIEPVIPRYDHALGRVKLKVVSEEYLTRKDAKDFADDAGES